MQVSNSRGSNSRGSPLCRDKKTIVDGLGRHDVKWLSSLFSRVAKMSPECDLVLTVNHVKDLYLKLDVGVVVLPWG